VTENSAIVSLLSSYILLLLYNKTTIKGMGFYKFFIFSKKYLQNADKSVRMIYVLCDDREKMEVYHRWQSVPYAVRVFPLVSTSATRTEEVTELSSPTSDGLRLL